MAAVAGRARADGWTASLEPGYGHIETETTDQAGDTTRETSDLLTQRYRLALDRSLTDYLLASAGGTFLAVRQWKETDGFWTVADGEASSFFGRLTLGSPVLNAALGVDRNQQHTLGAPGPATVTENYSAFASWRPLRLPTLDLHAGHVNAYDLDRRDRDATNDTASVALKYEAATYDLRYILSWARTIDHLHDSESSNLDQSLVGTRTATLLEGRTTLYVSGTLQTRNTFAVGRGPNATVSRQQLPDAGLSAVETFPATAEQITLTTNERLIDANLVTSASVNLGFGAAAGGDTNARHVGAQFAGVATQVPQVNTIAVYLDRPLTTEVGAALAVPAKVYQSNDNALWTEVLPATAIASRFENRLEITIPTTQARFLKVRLLGLLTDLTTDAAYRDLFVTEVQFFLVESAPPTPSRTSGVAASANGFARTTIVRSIDLAHDISLAVARDSETDVTRYTLVNGLSAARRVWADIGANARLARQDEDIGAGHHGQWQWTASLTGRPLPTAYWSLIYAGSARERIAAPDDTEPVEGMDVGHSVSALGRADLYDGISAQANGSVTSSTAGFRATQQAQASGSLSLTPNRWVTLTAGALFSRARTTNAEDFSAQFTKFGRLDGSLSLTPAPAISATGTVSRILYGIRATTLGTVQASYFPLRGDLQLSVAYSKTLDTAAETTTEIFTPSLRWNLRRGVSLTSSYTVLRTVAPAQDLRSRALAATLLITL